MEAERGGPELKDEIGALLCSIFDMTSEGIAIVRKSDYFIVKENATFRSMVGHKSLPSSILDLTPDSKGLRGAIDCSEEACSNLQLEFFGVSGKRMKASVRVGNLGERDLAVVCITDNTKRIEAEESAIRNQSLAAVGTMAAGIAHEFNNLHGIIKGNTDLILFGSKVVKDEEHVISQEVQKKLEVVKDSIDRASEITSNLLLFARDSKNESFSLFEIEETLCGVLRLVEGDFKTEGIKIYTGNLDNATLTGHRGQIGQVMMNVLVNAKHAMRDSEDKILFVDCERTNGHIVISIRDTGIGIADEDQSKVFDPFFSTKGERATDTGQKSIKGTGLGLSLSHSIVSNHGGKIEVKSKVGKGTAIIVTLPVYKGKAPKKVAEPDFKNNGRVLILEDEERLGNILVEVLEAAGYETVYSDDGESALVEHEKKPFNSVIVDLLMPRMPGSEFLDKLLKAKVQPRKIVLTGNPKAHFVDYAKLGVDVVIMKPFEIEHILYAVKGDR